MKPVDIIDELAGRGLLADQTSAELREHLAEPRTIYIGFDPTAPSLHVGSLIPLVVMRHLRNAGHNVVALLGSATAQIGDPSGRSSERVLLDPSTIKNNMQKLLGQIGKIVPNVSMVDNNAWFGGILWTDMLRDTGKHFTVSAMLNIESVKSRLYREGGGISFTEFAYSLMQARDFLELNRRADCTVQFGATDQWGNICAGLDLVHRVTGKEVFGFTVPLLTDANGTKYGKSAGNAVRLDESPFRLFQFFLNIEDAEVERLLRMLTFLDTETIDDLMANPAHARLAQRRLAHEVVTFVHGQEAAYRALWQSEVMFSKTASLAGLSAQELDEMFANVPTVEMDFTEPVSVIAMLVEVGAAPTRSEAKRLIEQGGVSVNNQVIGLDAMIAASDLIDGQSALVKRGRRNVYLVRRKS